MRLENADSVLSTANRAGCVEQGVEGVDCAARKARQPDKGEP